MRDIASQSKSLEVTFSESFLVQFVLDSLHAEYGPFKISYNTHKEKWSINKLLTMCVYGEGRLKQEKLESTHLLAHEKGQPRKGKRAHHKKKNKKNQIDSKDIIRCFFCKKKCHIKKECINYMAWLEK